VPSKLAYLVACRSIQLLALARGDAAKDLEILVPRHQLAAWAVTALGLLELPLSLTNHWVGLVERSQRPATTV
jgi:hypothetical protein